MRKLNNMKYAEALLATILAVFAPIKALIAVALILIGADLVSGILAALKKKQPITSAGLRRTVTKLMVYLAAICLGYLVEHYMVSDYLPISKMISGVISLVELKSILENLDVLNGSSLFKTVIEKLGSVNDIDKQDPPQS